MTLPEPKQEQKHVEIVIRFRALKDDDPWQKRLRRLLKYALRTCKFQARDYGEER